MPYPYCALAHEMGHSFQYMTEADGARGFSGSPLVEYTSQWMLWQVYPSWVDARKVSSGCLYETDALFAAERGESIPCAPGSIEYWSYRHGLDFIARLWKEREGTEDPVSAYKRLTGVSQEQFNDEVYDAASRFVTWDLPRVKASCSSYANQHSCKMEGKENGWMQIAQSRCPQNYGYNAIRLSVPEGGTEVRLDFEALRAAGIFTMYTRTRLDGATVLLL